MAVTTVPVTIRVDKNIVGQARTEAAKRGVFYQTVLNERLAKSFGVTLSTHITNKKVLAAKGKKVKPKPKVKKGYKKSKKAKQ
jgi:hypothetical protein